MTGEGLLGEIEPLQLGEKKVNVTIFEVVLEALMVRNINKGAEIAIVNFLIQNE